ncbi:hypothetical protein AB0D12_04530 [Streptomyces sp. NPDC048479]|uniref:hypothetical protein n=1 Tax=Streptomyces sp. NPDC048479 TaxID=3154725 RepID=UPI0034187B11
MGCTTTQSEEIVRRYLISLGAVVAAIVATVVAVTSTGDNSSSKEGRKRADCCWKDDVTPASISKKIGIRIPAGASDLRAGLKSSDMYDTAILAFVVPDKAADDYLSRMVQKGEKMIPNTQPTPAEQASDAPFTHLGVPEPKSLEKDLLLWGGCPETLESPESEHLNNCIDLYAHKFKRGSTRIYVRSAFE